MPAERKSFEPDESDRLGRLERLVVLSLVLGISPLPFYRRRRRTPEFPGTAYEALDHLNEALGSQVPRVDTRLIEEMADRIWRHIEGSPFREFPYYPEEVDVLFSRLGRLESGVEDAFKDIHTFFSAQSFGLNVEEVPLPRFLAVRLYLREGNVKEAGDVVSAVGEFLNAFGFEPSDDYEIEGGSIFKRMISKSKEALTQPEVTSRLQEAEHALKLKLIEDQQASINQKHAHAAAELLQAMEKYPHGVCQTGSLLLVKTPQGCAIRTLSIQEMMHLEKNPSLLKDPETILAALDGCGRHPPAIGP